MGDRATSVSIVCAVVLCVAAASDAEREYGVDDCSVDRTTRNDETRVCVWYRVGSIGSIGKGPQVSMSAHFGSSSSEQSTVQELHKPDLDNGTGSFL